MNTYYRLNDEEISAIKSLSRQVAMKYKTAEDEALISNACLYSHELPRSLRSFLNDFRMKESSEGYCVISGYPVDDVKIGPTPSHWRHTKEAGTALEEEILLILFGSLLGDVFAWSTQQAGYFVHNVMPIKEHENEQLGTGSKELLWWHVEDAFHPYRGDYLGMMCLRNPDRVATTIACVDGLELDEDQIKTLFEPHFVIHPDESHLEKNRGIEADGLLRETDGLRTSYEKITAMSDNPEKLAVLFGSPESPYLRLDPYFMVPVVHPEARDAFDGLIKSLNKSLKDLVLEPGDYCFIDNYRAVHGRRAFQAREDGTDRWLTRINVTRDLRKSRSSRSGCTSRVII